MFQVISRLGHFLIFGEAFANMTEEEQEEVISAIAAVDFRRNATPWQGKVVMDGRLLTQRALIDDATDRGSADFEHPINIPDSAAIQAPGRPFVA